MIRNLLRLGVWLLAFVGVGAYLLIGFRRLHYPLEIDCIEGVMMDHVARLVHGQPIYVAPSLHYIPLAYMPLFSVVSSWLARGFGLHLWVARLVSFGSTLLLMALVAGIVRAETRRWTLAAAAAGLYAMAFGYTGHCYDVARPDSLMLLLSFAGLAALRFVKGPAGAVVAALLLVAGFFAKQHSVLFSFGALAYLAFHDRRRLPLFAALVIAGCAGGYFLVTAWLGPWFRVFTWSVPHGWSQVSPPRIAHYFLGAFGVLGVLSLPALLALRPGTRPAGPGAALWWWTGLAGVGTGLLGTLDPYAYKHVFTPTVVALAVLGPVALDRLARGAGGRGRAAGLAMSFVYVALAVQFVPLRYSVRGQLPRPHAAEADRAFADVLRRYPDGVMVPGHGWYTTHDVGRCGLQIIALDDIVRSRGNELLARDPRYLERMFDSLATGPRRPAIVTDVPLASQGPMWVRIAPGYRLADSLGGLSETLRPISGNRYTPTYVYLPVDPPARSAERPAP